jgi:hypothetical protein
LQRRKERICDQKKKVGVGGKIGKKLEKGGEWNDILLKELNRMVENKQSEWKHISQRIRFIYLIHNYLNTK